MSHSSASQRLVRLSCRPRMFSWSDPLTQCLIPRLKRTFATTIDTPTINSSHITPIESSRKASDISSASRGVLATLYSWPNLEPQRFEWYPSKHLDMPLRKDILHRAVIYEADAHRGIGTASTKYRKDVHGSNRKIQMQKGTGRARVGDKKSPIRRGGGVVFGPHPRDFTTELPRKIYDIAWRTALSHRYRRGELVILGDHMKMPKDGTPRLLENIFLQNKWGHPNGRSLLVADILDVSKIKTSEQESLAQMQYQLFESMEQIGRHGLIRDLDDVDVKDLLETGRVVIGQKTLRKLLSRHSADL